MFNVVLPLDRILNVIELLEIDEQLQSMPFRKAINESGAMFMDSTNEITGHADIKRAVRSICQNVDEAASHEAVLQDVDGRDKPGHDGFARPWTIS